MKRLTASQKDALQKLLIGRWAALIQEDNKTDGFSEEVADLLGVDLSEVSTETHEFTAAVIQMAVRWLQKLPEVK